MEQDLRTYSPLTLAFLGDAVYSLQMRQALIMRGNAHARDLHNAASHMVSAASQARVYDRLMSDDGLPEEERDILRRGCNAHVSHQAKNASSTDYHKATGLEALFGYLFLKNENDRISELTELGIELSGGCG